MTQRILVTGAAGIVGGLMRDRLARPGRVLRLLDVAPLGAARAGEEHVAASVTDAAALADACCDVDAIVHLGGLSREAAWADTVAVNITGTQTLLQAAQQAGIGRVVLASSNHAVGFRSAVDVPQGGLPADSVPRPDTFYGVSKAAIEALGSLYASRFGMDVIVVRIGSCFPDPIGLGPRGLVTWLSPDDAARLFEACLSTPSPGHRVVWGVSANTRRVYSLAEAEALGYRPEDDAERFAARITAPPALTDAFVGGAFTTTALGAPNPL